MLKRRPLLCIKRYAPWVFTHLPNDDWLDLVIADELVAYELLAVAGIVVDCSTCPSNLAEKPLVDLSE